MCVSLRSVREGRQKCVASWLDDQAFFMLVYLCVKSANSSSSLGECMSKCFGLFTYLYISRKVKAGGCFAILGVYNAENESNQPCVSVSHHVSD